MDQRMNKSKELYIEDLDERKSTRQNSARRSIFNNPSFINPEALSHSKYFQRVPYISTKIMYEEQEVTDKVAVEKTVTEYKEIRKKKLVPKEKIVRDHMVVESKISYVPHLVPQMTIQYVPVAVETERVEYVPQKRQVIHNFDVFDQYMPPSAMMQTMNNTILRGVFNSTNASGNTNTNTGNRRSNSFNVTTKLFNPNSNPPSQPSNPRDPTSNSKPTIPQTVDSINRQNIFLKNTVYKYMQQREQPNQTQRIRTSRIFDVPKRSSSLSRSKLKD